MKDPARPTAAATRPRGPHATASGAALVDVLIALVVLGLAAAAVTGTTLGAAGEGRTAALDGRRAELALRTADALRSGRFIVDSGASIVRSGGEGFEVVWARRDDVTPGAIEVEVRPVRGGASLRLAPARPVS